MAENSKTPLVSIIMPVHNSENYVADAIESIVNQHYNHWELIIVDDGSTDKSFEVISKYNSSRIKIFQATNSGAATARNFGYRQSKGDYIKFFDSDDLISPEMIEEQINLALLHHGAIISSKWGRFYANDLSDFRMSQEECWQDLPALEWICSSWKYARSMTQPGIFLIPRHIIEQAGLWNTKISQLDDTEYFTRTILQAKAVIFAANSTLFYRSGNQNSLSAKHNLSEAESSYQSLLLSISHLLDYENNKQTRLLSANSLQEFVFKIYPNFKELVKITELKINALGGSNLAYKTSPLANFLSKFLGWKLVKQLQTFKNG